MSSPMQPNPNSHPPVIQTGRVVSNERLCREHFRLTFRLPTLGDAYAGQFVHLRPEARILDGSHSAGAAGGGSSMPMLRRAFSIAGLSRDGDAADADVIYRVVGKATRWMASLVENNVLSVLGPLGNRFPIQPEKSEAWLVAGGVGLPPMLWLAEALQAAGKRCVAFCGAQKADLLPLRWNREVAPSVEASDATACCQEFAAVGAETVISTDDGSLGFHGHIGAAMEAYHRLHAAGDKNRVVYTCGPERMMRFVAEYCVSRDIECYVCMERAMACGTGLCQSCVVPVVDSSDPDGWRYRLCCTDGPVFAARDIVWEPANVT